MDKALQAQLTVLGNEVQVAAIPDSCRQTVAWCLRQLAQLYVKLRATNESRYSDDITRLVQGIRKELTSGKSVSPPSRQLATSLLDRLGVLHEQFGLPRLDLKPLRILPPKPKAGERR